nr:uncharacterized protein LOC114105308 isoform X1 [Marmota flaviventris]
MAPACKPRPSLGTRCTGVFPRVVERGSNTGGWRAGWRGRRCDQQEPAGQGLTPAGELQLLPQDPGDLAVQGNTAASGSDCLPSESRGPEHTPPSARLSKSRWLWPFLSPGLLCSLDSAHPQLLGFAHVHRCCLHSQGSDRAKPKACISERDGTGVTTMATPTLTWHTGAWHTRNPPERPRGSCHKAVLDTRRVTFREIRWEPAFPRAASTPGRKEFLPFQPIPQNTLERRWSQAGGQAVNPGQWCATGSEGPFPEMQSQATVVPLALSPISCDSHDDFGDHKLQMTLAVGGRGHRRHTTVGSRLSRGPGAALQDAVEETGEWPAAL